MIKPIGKPIGKISENWHGNGIPSIKNGLLNADSCGIGPTPKRPRNEPVDIINQLKGK
jgi:hypothetical protein